MLSPLVIFTDLFPYYDFKVFGTEIYSLLVPSLAFYYFIIFSIDLNFSRALIFSSIFFFVSIYFNNLFSELIVYPSCNSTFVDFLLIIDGDAF